MLKGLAEYKGFRRMWPWAYYIRGGRDMLLRLLDFGIFEIPQSNNHKPFAANIKFKPSSQKVINKAVIDMLLSDKRYIEMFLLDGYEMMLKDVETGGAGKSIIKCRVAFVKQKTTYEEV